MPVSCHHYQHSETKDWFRAITVNEPAGVNEVSFELSLVEDAAYCSEILWYSKLAPQVDIYFSPQVSPSPQIQYTIEGTFITIVVPRDEQYKFPTLIPVQIVLGVQWTNPSYESIVASGPKLLFQNVALEVIFTVPAQTILPVIAPFTEELLQGESVVLDGSATTVSSVQNPDISISWVCPASIASLCQDKTGAVVEFSWTEFVAAKGAYGRAYQFTMESIWTKPNGDVFTNSHNVTLTWWDIAVPLTNLVGPNKVISTSQNVFTLEVSNYDVTTST